jgi:hypothetical protein
VWVYDVLGLIVALAGLGLAAYGAYLLVKAVDEHPSKKADEKIILILGETPADLSKTDDSKTVELIKELIPLLKDMGQKAKVGFILLAIGAFMLVGGFATAAAQNIGTHDSATATPSPEPTK